METERRINRQEAESVPVPDCELKKHKPHSYTILLTLSTLFYVSYLRWSTLKSLSLGEKNHTFQNLIKIKTITQFHIILQTMRWGVRKVAQQLEHWLFWKTRVLFPAPTQWLTAIYNSNLEHLSQYWPAWALGPQVVHSHTRRQIHSHTHKIVKERCNQHSYFIIQLEVHIKPVIDKPYCSKELASNTY